MQGDGIEVLLTEKKSFSAKPAWSADVADLFVLFCSFLLSAVSIVMVALVFLTQGTASYYPMPFETLSILQRVISSLSVAVTSAVIMVAGKRYVLFKLARGGLRGRRVALYSNPSIGNLATYLAFHGVEFPLLSLSVVWGLALVTSLTVDNCWEMGSYSDSLYIAVPFGPFVPATPGSSWVVPASEQLTFVMSSLCFGVAGTVGLVNITNTGQSMGPTYYPPLPYSMQNAGFSFSTTMNGFDISIEPLSSLPSTAQNLTCTGTQSYFPFELWSDRSDDQSLSIIATDPADVGSIFRFNASAIVMGGTLSSTGNYTEFALNGTSWPNVMPKDNQWTQDITSLICNATFSSVGTCIGTSFSDFSSVLNTEFLMSDKGDTPYRHWSTVLNMAIGAYSAAMFPHIGGQVDVPITQYGFHFMSHYGVHILISNIVVSLIMLIVVVRLRMGSRLGPDFINSTRLLLNPLKKPELFNASLKTTLDSLADPYMVVREDNEFLLVERTLTGGRKKFTLRRQAQPTETCI